MHENKLKAKNKTKDKMANHINMLVKLKQRISST